jgi:hypothetical protein
MTPEQKASIDNMSYEGMLSLWRNAPAGHPYFQGDTGDYYSKVMKEKREKVGNAEHVRASKNIGW